jgi:hypothetical protein
MALLINLLRSFLIRSEGLDGMSGGRRSAFLSFRTIRRLRGMLMSGMLISYTLPTLFRQFVCHELKDARKHFST